MIEGCQKCPLHLGATNIVVGDGPDNARIMIVGEAPGANEDAQGKPFVGASGRLLDNFLTRVGIPRPTVYITNVIKCRPPGNRDPTPEEIAACIPYLHDQIAHLKPTVIVTLGRFAAATLTQTYGPITSLVGRDDLTYDGAIPVVVLFHPSYLLRRRDKDTYQAFLAGLQRVASLVQPSEGSTSRPTS